MLCLFPVVHCTCIGLDYNVFIVTFKGGGDASVKRESRVYRSLLFCLLDQFSSRSVGSCSGSHKLKSDWLAKTKGQCYSHERCVGVRARGKGGYCDDFSQLLYLS